MYGRSVDSDNTCSLSEISSVNCVSFTKNRGKFVYFVVRRNRFLDDISCTFNILRAAACSKLYYFAKYDIKKKMHE